MAENNGPTLKINILIKTTDRVIERIELGPITENIWATKEAIIDLVKGALKMPDEKVQVLINCSIKENPNGPELPQIWGPYIVSKNDKDEIIRRIGEALKPWWDTGCTYEAHCS